MQRVGAKQSTATQTWALALTAIVQSDARLVGKLFLAGGLHGRSVRKGCYKPDHEGRLCQRPDVHGVTFHRHRRRRDARYP